VRVAVLSESFLPQVNGVTNSVLRVLEYLERTGHEAVVAAPGTAAPEIYAGARVISLPAWPMPRYHDVAVSRATTRRVERFLAESGADVVHLASPFMLGPPVVRAAARLGIPVVSAFQTDVPRFARHYGLAFGERWAWNRVVRIHSGCNRTLAPSAAYVAELTEHGVPRVHLWPRGVDGERFSPARRSDEWRAAVGGADVLVGYVGRLAPEKQVLNLRALSGVPGIRVVIIGDGPARATLQAALPTAHFTGFLGGSELAVAMASLDILVHTGEAETFCQTIQEGLASGVPVVAPGVGGPLDLVSPSRTGWLYEPGTLTDLADRVRDLAGDHAKRCAMGEAARASVVDRTWTSVCDQVMRHYRQACGIEVAA
jgi:phosphatidylinositol alpha 1,6-mannosyltransferase